MTRRRKHFEKENHALRAQPPPIFQFCCCNTYRLPTLMLYIPRFFGADIVFPNCQLHLSAFSSPSESLGVSTVACCYHHAFNSGSVTHSVSSWPRTLKRASIAGSPFGETVGCIMHRSQFVGSPTKLYLIATPLNDW